MYKMIVKKLFLMAAFCAFLSSGQLDATFVQGALLQTQINASPMQQSHGTSERVQPGTRMTLTAVVKNIGDIPSAPGKIFLRFCFPKPLDKQPASVIFNTETTDLPSIPPGDFITINFATPHQWPSLFDYIRNDWAMREYEAVVNVGGSEHVTGTRVISFSAHYYEGPAYEKSARVSSADYMP